MNQLFRGIANWYHKTVYCDKLGHSYVELKGANKKRCVTCGDEFECILKK